MFPSDPDGRPENTINCRCGLIYDVMVGDEKLENKRDKTNENLEKDKEIRYNKNDETGTNSQVMPDYPRDERIDKLNSTDEIVKYFQYEDKYGDEFSPIHYDSWNKQPIEVQREVAQGLQYAKNLFKLDMLPNKIEFNKLDKGIYGQISLKSGVLSLNTAKINELNELYGTAVHEMAHYYDYMNDDISEKIFNQALKNLGLRKNGKDTDKLLSGIVGMRSSEKSKIYEIFAYSIEYKTKNKGNLLSNEIFKIAREGMIK